MYRIACMGEAMLELSGLDFQTGQAGFGFAGDTYNTAVNLRQLLGEQLAEVSFVTCIGQDKLSDQFLNALAANGIEHSDTVRHETRNMGLYAIELDETGERSFSYWRSQSAAKTMFDATTVDLNGFDLVYFSGISVAILSEIGRENLLSHLKTLRQSGTIIVFDTNYRPTLWESGTHAREMFERIWPLTDIALPSMEDLQALGLPEAPETAAAYFRSFGVSSGAISNGASDTVFFDADNTLSLPTPIASNVADTTGAGDAFNAGFLAATISGADAKERIKQGQLRAVQTLGHKGALRPIQ